MPSSRNHGPVPPSSRVVGINPAVAAQSNTIASEPYGINWAALRGGSIVVDVGGGLGTSCLAIANTYPHLRFVIQDKPNQGAHRQLSNAYFLTSNGLVKYQEHDIFAPQYIRTAALFVLKHVTPGLSDFDVQKVFASLCLAAAPETQLVLIDDEREDSRTPRHVSRLLKGAGWRVTGTHTEPGRTYLLRVIFAVPT